MSGVQDLPIVFPYFQCAPVFIIIAFQRLLLHLQAQVLWDLSIYAKVCAVTQHPGAVVHGMLELSRVYCAGTSV